MEWRISNAIVVDDAFGPPVAGALSAQDKNIWIDFISGDTTAQQALLNTFADAGLDDLDVLLGELTSSPEYITKLWNHCEEKTLLAANLELLFNEFMLRRQGKVEKPLAVFKALASLVGPGNVRKFWRMEDAVAAMPNADIAFVDFFMNDNEQLDAAFDRIRNNKTHLKKPKLLYFMSSRAGIETQQHVREIVGKRTAFFEVVTKTALNEAWVIENVKAKSSSYIGNRRLEELTHALMDATESAAKEFLAQFDSLEMHDLRLLDLARLANEGERISAYLAWLASESIAAKIRRLCASNIRNIDVDPGAIGFTGQIKQGKILFDLFSEVVFGPAHEVDEQVHFGEIFVPKQRRRPVWKTFPKEPVRTSALVHRRSSRLTSRQPPSPFKRAAGKRLTSYKAPVENCGNEDLIYPASHDTRPYLLALTPACDLARCMPSTNVLCVVGTAQNLSDIRIQARERLFGKHQQGLRHLLKIDGCSPLLITWRRDQTVMIPVRRLLSGEFRRVAQMNELYAQEVKEEILRELGRIGTQINPPPPFALHAILRWRTHEGAAFEKATTGKDKFYSALLTYSEQSKKAAPTVVLSDEFRKWAAATIVGSLSGQPAPAKLTNSLTTLKNSAQFILKNDDTYQKDGLLLRISDDAAENTSGNIWIEISLGL
jgi:hypothetical protein